MLIEAEFCNYDVYAETDEAKVSILIVNRGVNVNVEFSYSLAPEVKPEKDELIKDAWIKILAQLLNMQPWTIQSVRDSGNLKVRVQLGITKQGWLIVKEETSLTYEPINSFERKMEHLFEINGKIFEFSPFGSTFEPMSNKVNPETFPSRDMFNVIATDESQPSFRYRIHGNPNDSGSIIVDRSELHGDGIFIGSSFTVKDIVPGSIETAENGFRFTGITTDTTLGSMPVEDVKKLTLFAPFAKP